MSVSYVRSGYIPSLKQAILNADRNLLNSSRLRHAQSRRRQRFLSTFCKRRWGIFWTQITMVSGIVFSQRPKNFDSKKGENGND